MFERTVLFLTHEQQLISPWVEAAQAAQFKTLLLSPQNIEDFPDPAPLKAASFIIEWLPVQDQYKESTLRMIESLFSPEACILSAAHEVMGGTIASWLQHPKRLTGFCPMGLYRRSSTVTVSKTLQTDAKTIQKTEELFKAIGCQSQWIQDTPGMVLPRIYAMLANEAAFALQEQVASAADIDQAMRLGTNYPYGPLAWADMVGVDVVVNILQNLWQVYHEERYRPCLLLQRMVRAGHLGQQTRQGFFSYETASVSVMNKQVQTVQ